MREMRPRDRVVELLRTLKEAQQDYRPNAGHGGPQLMPDTYNQGSYKELERCLWVMKERKPTLWWHTTMRYRDGNEMFLVVNTRKTVKGRVPIAPPLSEILIEDSWVGSATMRVKVYTWSSAVQPRLCEQGVDWLLNEMHGGDTSRIQLPLPFLYRALGMMEKVAV